MKKWEISEEITDDKFSEFPEINPVILQLLFNRQMTTQSRIDEFLYPDFNKDIHDPYILVDMEKAVNRIITAIKKKEKVVVYGDYDADGVTASVLLVSSLRLFGLDVNVYIPHRETEGYGMNSDSVKDIIDNKTDLVITVDCGISNKDEIQKLMKNNVDVIVTDHHHEPPKLPKAIAIINPKLKREKYPWDQLAGVGVTFKLVQALIKKIHQDKIVDAKIFNQYGGILGFEKWLLDLVSIGTITDCMSLLGENRTLVKYGLVVLRKTKRIGLRELIAHANINIDKIETQQVAFQIGPRINAAGRIDHANVAYELLLTDEFEDACRLSNKLSDTNVARQKITDEIIKSVTLQLKDTDSKKVLFAIGEDWMVGVIGLVAGKISDIYSKPVFIMSRLHNNIIGSGRSIPQFNMIKALEKKNNYFLQYGGHSQACGFTLKDDSQVEAFMNDMEKLARKALKDVDVTPVIIIDKEIKFCDINWELVENIEKFAPFGEDNREPIFLIKNIEIIEINLVGQTKDHVRLLLKEDNIYRKAICFGIGSTWGKQLKQGDIIDIVSNISVNEWNGNKEIQLKVIDIKFS